MLKKLGVDKADITKGGVNDIEDRICRAYPAGPEKKAAQGRGQGLAALAALKGDDPEAKKYLSKSIEKMAEDVGLGVMTLKDIIEEIKKPARDPREDAPPVVFRNDVKDIADLKIGMELTGTVRNVVDFGAFVDIGIKNDGLVHISEMADRFINHPMDVVSVGDTVNVRILEIDYDRQKTKLTMKKPQ
jgi:uncharacterized protein